MALLHGKIQISCVGKLKELHWQQAQKIYLRKIQRYLNFSIIEVKDLFGHGIPEGKAIKMESEKLLESSKESSLLIAMTPNGKPYDSYSLSSFIQKGIENFGKLTFFIGGPIGLSQNLIEKCPNRISLSKMTFPHELARIILLEQIFRAMTILNGEKYHK